MVDTAEHHCRQSLGSTVEINVLADKSHICAGNEALIIFRYNPHFPLHFRIIGNINETDRCDCSKIGHLTSYSADHLRESLFPDNLADIFLKDQFKLMLLRIVEIKPAGCSYINFHFLPVRPGRCCPPAGISTVYTPCGPKYIGQFLLR